MSNSYPTLKRRYGTESEKIEELNNDILSPLADQEEATKLVSKLLYDMNLISQVLPPQQSDRVFQLLKQGASMYKTRLVSYSALCQQRSIVEQYEEKRVQNLLLRLKPKLKNLKSKSVLRKGYERCSYYQA